MAVSQTGPDLKNQVLKDYSNRNLRNKLFLNDDLGYSSFSGSDLRGVYFSGSNLAGADFSKVKTGIPPFTTFLLVLLALFVSALSGYVAMLAGATIQGMIKSSDQKIMIAGVLSLAMIVILVVFYYLKGGRKTLVNLVIPACFLALLFAFASYLFGVGTGRGMFYLAIAVVLTVFMFAVGTIARVAAGSLSNIIFFLVAVAGSVYGKSVGGEIGTVVLAISCAVISKKALSGAPGFDFLKSIASYITIRYGTSFRNCNMANADFSNNKFVKNSDFTGAHILFVRWGNCTRRNCVTDTNGKM